MSEWPDAPRLADALRRRVDDPDEGGVDAGIDVDAAWRNLSVELDEAASAPHHRVALDPNRGHRGAGAPSRRRVLVMMAATCGIVVAVAVGHMVWRQPVDDRLSTIDEPATTEATQAPKLLPLAGCAGFGPQPTRFVAGADSDSLQASIRQGAEVDGEIGPSAMWIIVGDGPLAQSATSDLASGGGTEVIARVEQPATVSQVEALSRGMYESACPLAASMYLVVAGSAAVTSLAADAVCSEMPGVGFTGFVVIGSPGPAPACVARRPVILVDPVDMSSAASARVLEWADGLRCAGSEEGSDSAGNAVTTWARCDVTLRHVVVAHNGAGSLGEAVRQITSIPG